MRRDRFDAWATEPEEFEVEAEYRDAVVGRLAWEDAWHMPLCPHVVGHLEVAEFALLADVSPGHLECGQCARELDRLIANRVLGWESQAEAAVRR